jgi:4-aminobutyrate aminotransferase-like enzyme
MTPIELLVETRHRLLGRNLSIAYDAPVKIVRGSMQYLYDEDGRQYLDGYNNVAHVGHCHPKVVEAGLRQMQTLNTNTRYLHDTILHYAERLTSTLPDPLNVCYFVNSGSEANELAIRLARAHTNARDIIVLDHAYHGNTTTLIDISPYKHDGPGGSGAPSWVHKVALPDTYRGLYRANDPHAAYKYAQHVVDVIKKTEKLCSFIAESMPSVGGQIVLPQGYLNQVYDAVRSAGGVCIADEVQTGYGRIGKHFWAFESYDVVPDIVVLGKPIGNGHPIGAVITTSEIAASFDNGMEFFSTFGGNTVSCAIGLAVLEVVQEENLPAHALTVGEQLLNGLREIKNDLIGDVRGSGLFLGVELINDDAPATKEAHRIVNAMRDRGILIGTDGPFHNVLKIRPPMPFSGLDGDHLLTTLEKSLTRDADG